MLNVELEVVCQLPIQILAYDTETKVIPGLTHWGRVMHICVSDLTSIVSDNGLSPGRRQAIIRTNAGILLIRPLGTNFSEFLVEILIFSFKKMRLKVSSAKRRPFCLGLNELIVLRIEYSGRTRSIPWLQMPWLLASPGHQQSWYWLLVHRIYRLLSSTRRIPNTRPNFILRNDQNTKILLCLLK